jgi:hypothetical protein
MSPPVRPRPVACCLLATTAGLLLTAAELPAQPLNDKVKEIAGTAEFLRAVPKHFATLKAMDRAQRRVTLLLEGDSQPQVWQLAPDAEVKVAGWWGRLDQLRIGDRVWVWLQVDRVKQPVAVSMLADELSEQDIHGSAAMVESRSGDELTVTTGPGKSRKLKADKAEFARGKEKASVNTLQAGEKVYVQSAGDRARLILDAAAFELRRAGQKAALRQRWADEGLPGTVAFLHQFSGELDYVLDHEALRWGRSLQVGDKVTLQASPPIPAVVKHVRPWRERTQLRLVVNSFDQGDLTLGQRLWLRRTPPPAEVDTAALPPDLDRPRGKEERVEWFLASIYCTCKVKNDTCTGHFYTLASCNPNGCGMPNQMRKTVAALIDQGRTDEQIFDELLKQQGPDLLRPHLLP